MTSVADLSYSTKPGADGSPLLDPHDFGKDNIKLKSQKSPYRKRSPEVRRQCQKQVIRSRRANPFH